jgi:hypothetical protein
LPSKERLKTGLKMADLVYLPGLCYLKPADYEGFFG